MEIGRCPEIPPSSVNTIIADAAPYDGNDDSASFVQNHQSEVILTLKVINMINSFEIEIPPSSVNTIIADAAPDDG